MANPRNELLPIQPGTQVRVSDGTPMPPLRFNKKVDKWREKNFDAVVVGEEPAGNFRPEPVYRLQFGKLHGWMLCFTTARAEFVAPIDGVAGYKIKVTGMDAVVDIGGAA